MAVQPAFGKHIPQAQNSCIPGLWPSADVIIFAVWASQKERSELIRIYLHLSFLFYVHKWYVCFQIHGNRSSLEEFKLELGFGLTDESVLRDLALAVFLLLSWWFLLVVVGFFVLFCFLHTPSDLADRTFLRFPQQFYFNSGQAQLYTKKTSTKCHVHDVL